MDSVLYRGSVTPTPEVALALVSILLQPCKGAPAGRLDNGRGVQIGLKPRSNVSAP